MIENCFYLNRGRVQITPALYREMDTMDIMNSIDQLNEYLKQERKEIDKAKIKQ